MMARRIMAVCAALLLAACGGGEQPAAQPAAAPFVAVFGDSTTFGARPSTPPYLCGDRLTVPWVQTAAQASGLPLVNEGRNGTTLAQLEAGTDADGVCGNPPAHAPLAQWLQDNPTAVGVVMVYGINEAVRGEPQDYSRAIAIVHDAGRSVVLVEPFQVEDRPWLPQGLPERVQALRTSLRGYGVPVITVHELDGPGNAPDGLHPSQAYADALGRHIGRQLPAALAATGTEK